MHTWLLVAAEQAGSLTVRWGMLFLDPDMLFPSLWPLAVNSEANYTDSGAPARLPAPLCLHWCDVGFVSVCDRKRAMNPPPYGCVRLRGARTVEESWRSCGRAREEKVTATVLPDDVHDAGGKDSYRPYVKTRAPSHPLHTHILLQSINNAAWRLGGGACCLSLSDSAPRQAKNMCCCFVARVLRLLLRI